MTSENKTWESVKAKYLREVEKALSSVKHPRTKDVVEDVRLHLEQRFAELEPEQRNWEDFQAIITGMGPASDYAELLEPGAERPSRGALPKYLVGLGIAAVVVFIVILLVTSISRPVGYIVSFESVAPFEPGTPKELLDGFYNRHADGARTHHFRTEVRGDKLIGHICVDTEDEKNSLVKRLRENEKLVLVKARGVSQKELEKHFAMGQPSLESSAGTYIVTFKPVVPFAPQTARELLNAFNEKHPRGVRTHHYRTEVGDNALVGYICVDTKAGKDAVVNMLNESKKIALINAESASQTQLQKLYAMGQPSLRQPHTEMYFADLPISRHYKLLDDGTVAELSSHERWSDGWFKVEETYESASPDEKKAMIEQWITEAKGNNFDEKTRAIAALSNVAAEEAVETLIKIAEEPKPAQGNRPKWMAVRALGKIGDVRAVPVLIDLLHHYNKDTRLYARVGLCEITGVYFGDSKAEWRDWWQQYQQENKKSSKSKPETISNEGLTKDSMDSGRGRMEAELERLNRPEVRHERKLRRELQDSLEKWLKDNNETDAKKCDLLIEQIISQPRPSARAYFTAATAANLLGNPKKAIFILRKAIAEHPDEHAGGLAMPVKVTAYYRIGAIARHIGDAEEATKAYELLIKNTQGREGEEFRKADCYMYLAEIASEILKDKQLAMKRLQKMIATTEIVDADKLHSSEVVGLAILRDWASYEYARLKDGKAPVLDPSELDKAKLGALYWLAMGEMSLGGFEHQLLLERAAQSNKSPIDSAFAKLTLAVSYMHHANINPPEAEKYLSSLAESDSYFAPYANMMLQTVREEAKKIRERIPTLLNDLKRGDKEKRKWAAFKLARESGPDGVKALHQAQQDPNKYVRYEAACALARWGRDKSIKPDFNLILEALTDEDEQIREKARGAFSRQSWVEIGPDEITAIVSLMNDHYSKELFWTIRQLLSSAGLEASKAAVPKLIKLLNHEDSDVRTAVLDILRRMGPTASEAIPSLIQLLPYEDETRQDYLFAIIGGMGSAAEPFMSEIAEYLDHEDVNVRRAAANTLKKISPEKAYQIFKAREKAELR